MSFNLHFIMALLDHRQNSKIAKLQDGSGGKCPRAQKEPSQSGLGSILATEFMSCGQVMLLLRPLFPFWGQTPACAHHFFSFLQLHASHLPSPDVVAHKDSKYNRSRTDALHRSWNLPDNTKPQTEAAPVWLAAANCCFRKHNEVNNIVHRNICTDITLEGLPTLLRHLTIQTDRRQKEHLNMNINNNRREEAENMWNMSTEVVPMEIGTPNRRSVSS